MILAAAQTQPKQGDIESNLFDHYNLIELAAQHQVDLIVFPEMSITGYEREKARKLAFTPTDSRLDKLHQLSKEHDILVIVGAPILIDCDLHIGAFILKPDNSISIYTKHFLHAGEEEFFLPSFSYNPAIELGNERISLSICADIENPQHAENAGKNNISIYVASIFYTPNGIPYAHKTLSEYAKRHGMHVIMSNYCGRSWGLNSGGQSGFWDKNGHLISSLNETDPGLLIIDKLDGEWSGRSVRLG